MNFIHTPVPLPKSEPIYQHDSQCCQFFGRYAGHDVYFCTAQGYDTILARYGDDGPEYSNIGVELLRQQISHNPPVDCCDGKRRSFCEFVFSTCAPPYYRAFLLALAARESAPESV